MEMKDIKQKLEINTSSIMNEVITLKNANKELERDHEKVIDVVFCEFIRVIDTFESSEKIIREKKLDKEEDAQKCVKRMLNAKKKALAVLEKYNVKQITFENNQSNDDLCMVVDTEPDSTKETGEIVSIEKSGYTRNGRLIRRAEVVIIKN